MTPAQPIGGSTRRAEALADVGLVLILIVGAARVVTAFAPHVVFDVDPARFAGALDALGPAGSLALDVLLLIGCTAALAGEALAGRRVSWLLVAAAAVPGVSVAWHGGADLGDLWRGMTWLAAMLAAVAVAHVARRPARQALVLVVLAATLAPLVARGAMQVTIEHADTVAAFEATRDAFFADRGWAADSPAAQIYERRLRQAQPTGWFLTSNVYATIMLFGLVCWTGLGLAAARRHGGALRGHGWIGLAALAALSAAIMLLCSGSKGAMLAAVAGLALVVVPASWRRPWLLVVLIMAALAGVVVRGGLLSEGFLGERSLLFRWHYLQAATRVIAEAPLLGVGPDGFQEAYVRHRPPRNPEEVAFAHSMFVDWVATLGLVAVPWILLTLRQVWVAGRMLRDVEPVQRTGLAPPGRFVAIGVGAVVLLGLVPALLLRPVGHLDATAILARLLGVAGFAFLAVGARRLLGAAVEHGRGAMAVWSFSAAAVVMVIHAQIEMTFAQPGAVVWCMTALGVIAPVREGVERRPLVASAVIGVCAAVTVWWLTFTAVVPAAAQEWLMRRAAATLSHLVDAAPGMQDEVSLRRHAADVLADAYERLPTTPQPLEAAALQLAQAAAASPAVGRGEPLTRAADLMRTAITRHGRASSLATGVLIESRLAAETGRPEARSRAIALAQELVELDPHGIASWVRLGDLLWDAGERQGAIEAYRRALDADANFVLDPLKQMTEAQRNRVKERAQ